MRRLFVILIVALSCVGIVWAAAWRFGTPVEEGPARPRTEGGRFELPVEEPGPDRRSSRIDYARLDARLTRLMEAPMMVGLAVAIVEDGEIRFLKGYGETLAGSGDPVTPDTVFRWASLSKGVAGDMVALLAERRRLSLYDPVGRWSGLRLPGGDEARATVSDLLSHRLGLFGHAYDSKLEDGDDPRVLRASLSTLNAICSPGTCHAYQNVAYDAASEIVERITGVPYRQALEEHFFRPLGMTHASVTREGLTGAESWARPHPAGRNGRVPEEISEAYYRVPAAGGVNGSIKDLAIWMLAQMGLAGDVIPSSVLEAVQTPRVNTPRENRRRRKFSERTPTSSYGLGWRIFDYAGNRVIGHHGGVRGYRALILFDPERRSGVVALWNSGTGRPNGLEYEVMDMVYGLEFRDWLGIDEGAADPEPSPPDNEGGGA